MNYSAKKRYRGSEVHEYLSRRKSKKWEKEQAIFYELIKKIPSGSKILDLPIIVNSKNVARIQVAHIFLGHFIFEEVENVLLKK